MIYGGQSYRWRQLMGYLELICDGLLWLTPLALAVERLVSVSAETGLKNAIWPLGVVLVWGGSLLVYQLGFKMPARANLALVRTVYLILNIGLLSLYISLVRHVSAWSLVALASVAFNSLLYANFGLVFANLVASELLVLFNAQTVHMGQINVGSGWLVILGGLIYGITLLVLSLYNLDQPISNQHSVKSVTESANYRLSDDGLMTLINNLSSGIIRLDDQLRVNLYNASTLAILDTNVALTGMSIDQVLSLVDTEGQSVDLNKKIRQATRTMIDDRLIYQYQTGECIRLELTISPIKNAYGIIETGQYILMLRDVTLAKNLETERDEFISVISHELRTPIAIAEAGLSNMELMLRKPVEQITLSNALKKAHQQVVLLADMTNDLASLARADRAEIVQRELVDVNQLMQSLFEKYQPEVVAKGLRFDLDLDPRLTELATQALYLEEILQNLLINAIKYTIEGGIKLTTQVKTQTVEIAVIDTGLGISKNQQARIFDKFYRVEDYRTRQTSGTGLGLYVANKLAAKLGAELKLKSRIGFGSTFSLVLPKKTKLKQ